MPKAHEKVGARAGSEDHVGEGALKVPKSHERAGARAASVDQVGELAPKVPKTNETVGSRAASVEPGCRVATAASKETELASGPAPSRTSGKPPKLSNQKPPALPPKDTLLLKEAAPVKEPEPPATSRGATSKARSASSASPTVLTSPKEIKESRPDIARSKAAVKPTKRIHKSMLGGDKMVSSKPLLVQ